MSISCGILGLPNSGKSTLFSLLTGKEITLSQYPFSTISPNVASVEYVDDRLITIGRMFNFDKIYASTMTFVDLPSLTKNSAEGDGLGNAFLDYIRDVDVLICVVPYVGLSDLGTEMGMSDSKIENFLASLKVIDEELYKADLDYIEKKIKLFRDRPASTSLKMATCIEAKRRLGLSQEDRSNFVKGVEGGYLDDLCHEFLSFKPKIYVINLIDEVFNKAMLAEMIESLSLVTQGEMVLSSRLSDEKCYKGFLRQLSKSCYQRSKRIIFYTLVSGELHSWFIDLNSTISDAVKLIHPDWRCMAINVQRISFSEALKFASKGEKVNWADIWEDSLLDRSLQEGDILNINF